MGVWVVNVVAIFLVDVYEVGSSHYKLQTIMHNIYHSITMQLMKRPKLCIPTFLLLSLPLSDYQNKGIETNIN